MTTFRIADNAVIMTGQMGKPHYTADAIRRAKKRALYMLDLLEGKGVHKNVMSNICYGDAYYASSIAREFGCRDFTKLRKWASS